VYREQYMSEIFDLTNTFVVDVDATLAVDVGVLINKDVNIDVCVETDLDIEGNTAEVYLSNEAFGSHTYTGAEIVMWTTEHSSSIEVYAISVID
jgi:hypothetical protein